MRYAVCSDELFPVNEVVIDELLKRHHEVRRFGALLSGCEEDWAACSKEAALAIAREECDEGILFCYSGTGVTMVANKIAGIRAALVHDAETARIARIWNHANVLTLSNRLITNDLAKEIIGAWFSTPFDPRGQVGVSVLKSLDHNNAR